MWDLTICQTILLYIAFLMITIPLVVGGINAVIVGYFKAKEQHLTRVVGAFAKAFEGLVKDMTEKAKKMNDLAKKVDTTIENLEKKTTDIRI